MPRWAGCGRGARARAWAPATVFARVPLPAGGTPAAGIALVVAAFTVARPPLALLGAGLAVPALVRLTTGTDQLALLLYEVAVWSAAVEVLLRRRDRLSVADLVVELGGAP